MAKYKIIDSVKKGARIKGNLGGKIIDKEIHELTTKEIQAFVKVNREDVINMFFVIEEPKNKKKDEQTTPTTKEETGE